MFKPAQTKPMTRGKLATFLGICTKSLSRFLKKENIEIPPRALLKPKAIVEIIKKYHGEEDGSDIVQ